MAQVEAAPFHAPLLAKLQLWGYDSLHAPASLPLSTLIEKLDTATLAIMERLTQDLTSMHQSCHNLRSQLTTASDNCHKEEVRAESLRVQNERLVKENSELRAELEQSKAAVGAASEKMQQWQAHSMQKLEELERTNEGLRATLSRLSPCSSTECKTIGKADSIGQIVISEKLASSGTAFLPSGKKKELVQSREAMLRCKQLEGELQELKQKVSILTEKLEISQADVAARDKDIQKLCSAQAVQTVQNVADSASGIKNLKKELLFLQAAFNEELKVSPLNEGSRAELSAVDMIRQEVDATCKLLHNGQFGNEQILQEGMEMIEHKLRDLEAAVSEFESKKEGSQLTNSREADGLSMEEKLKSLPQEKVRDGSLNQEGDGEFDISQIHAGLKLIKGKVLLHQSGVKVESLQVKLEKLQSAMSEQEATISRLKLELSQKSDQLSFIADEKVAAEEALAACQNEAGQLTSLVKELDGSMIQLTSALTARSMERDYAVAAEKREAEARAADVEELTKKINGLISELEAANAEVARVQSELDRSKIQREEDRFQLAESRKQVESAERDIDQLKTLITQLDSTREELVVKLKSSISGQQLAENRQAALELELRRFVEQAETHAGEVGHMQKILEALGKERDHLLSQMESHTEKIVHLGEENSRLQAESRFLKRTLQSTEQKLTTEHSLFQQAESQISNLKDQLAVEETNRKATEGRCAAKVAELQAVTENFSNLTCEYQRVKNDLSKACTEHEHLMNELKNMTSKLKLSDQVISAREKEEETLLKTYERLYEDNQQMKLAEIEMESQLQQHVFQIQTMEDLLHRSEDQVRALQEEIHQHVASFQGLERQADIMSRSLAQQSALLDDYQKEKAVLMDQLTTAKQVAMELEQSCAHSVREMKSLETKDQYMAGLVQEAQEEVEALSTRYRLEHERVRELEQLLACLRAQEHQLELENKDSNVKTAMLKEQLFSLEEQVQTLQITRDTQNQEILRLKAKTEFEESRRCSSGIPHSPLSSRSLESQFLHSTAESASKVRELEFKVMSLTADLSKTSTLYNDCCERLQRAESQSLELKKEYENVLSLLAQVDEDRAQLLRNCKGATNNGAERGNLIRMVVNPSSRDHKSIDQPDLGQLQNECDRLKKDLASSEASRKAVETDFQLLISSVEEIKDDLVSKSSVPANLEAYLSHSNYDSE